MGVAVFSGMIGVTAFGLFLTPIFYVLLRTLASRFTSAKPEAEQHAGPAPTSHGPAAPALATVAHIEGI
jgi:multidrug efflux pump